MNSEISFLGYPNYPEYQLHNVWDVSSTCCWDSEVSTFHGKLITIGFDACKIFFLIKLCIGCHTEGFFCFPGYKNINFK